MNAVLESGSRVLMDVVGASKSFGKSRFSLLNAQRDMHPAVVDVSLQIVAGQKFGIVGESGCGKSTLARLMTGLIAPSSGKVFYDGRDLSALSMRELRQVRRQLQIVFQDPYASLNPKMTAGDIVAEGWQIFPDIVALADQPKELRSLLDQVGLQAEDAHRYPNEFSGGQRQRLSIARALAVRPRVIVLDEPVSALDSSIQAQILNLLSDIQENHRVAYVFISHDLTVVQHVVDTVAVMFAGRIVEMGSAAEIFANSLHPYTEDLIAAAPQLSGQKHAREFLGILDAPADDTGDLRIGCSYARRCKLANDTCRVERPILGPGADGGRHEVACFVRNTSREASGG